MDLMVHALHPHFVSPPQATVCWAFVYQFLYLRILPLGILWDTTLDSGQML